MSDLPHVHPITGEPTRIVTGVIRSYGAGTAAIDVIKAAAAAMGLDVPRSVEQRPDLRKQFAAGVALAGRASDELSSLLSPLGLGWSVQDGALQILGAGDIRAGQALVIDEDAGMLESPTMAPPSKPGAKPVLKVATLVYPQVTPGGTIDVRSRDIKGQYKVTDVSHTGDTHGADWRTEIEATAR